MTKNENTRMIYVASPYSHPSRVIRRWRYTLVCHYMAELLINGYRAFSPIAHSEGVHAACPDLPNNFAFWGPLDLDILRRCDSIHVLKLDGWRQSVGVQAEIAEGRNNDIPITYVKYPT